MATDYFKDIFQSSSPSKKAIEEVTSCITPKLFEQERRAMNIPYSRAEVEVDIKSLGPRKAPELDGVH